MDRRRYNKKWYWIREVVKLKKRLLALLLAAAVLFGFTFASADEWDDDDATHLQGQPKYATHHPRSIAGHIRSDPSTQRGVSNTHNVRRVGGLEKLDPNPVQMYKY